MIRLRRLDLEFRSLGPRRWSNRHRGETTTEHTRLGACSGQPAEPLAISWAVSERVGNVPLHASFRAAAKSTPSCFANPLVISIRPAMNLVLSMP